MEAEYDFSQGKRGAINPTPASKTRITIRLDDEILEWFREQTHRAGGGNYQTMINELCVNIFSRVRTLRGNVTESCS
jgi:uncharacterized protein (DUF4415 family)